MKLLIAFATICLAVTGQASQHPVILGADLPVRTIDANHFSHILVKQSQVAVDQTNRVVRLVVTGPSKFGPRCLSIGPRCRPQIETVTIDLPIIKEQQTRCGSRTIVAALDARPVDGQLQEITIKEMTFPSDRRCMVRAYPRYRLNVEYKTQLVSRLSGEEQTSISDFKGEQLEKILPLH